MFGMWMRFMFESTLLGLEAQRVIMRRMIAMSADGSRAQAKTQRMTTEKLLALMRVGAMLTVGRPSTSVVRHYRSRVRANEASPIAATAQAPVSERSSRSATDPQGTLSPAIPMAHQTAVKRVCRQRPLTAIDARTFAL